MYSASGCFKFCSNLPIVTEGLANVSKKPFCCPGIQTGFPLASCITLTRSFTESSLLVALAPELAYVLEKSSGAISRMPTKRSSEPRIASSLLRIRVSASVFLMMSTSGLVTVSRSVRSIWSTASCLEIDSYSANRKSSLSAACSIACDEASPTCPRMICFDMR
ncbi:hypothetical protein D3C77_417680 [compost metagenome]